MHAQERREVVLRNTLRRETEWLRRGAAARTHQAAGAHRARRRPGRARWRELGTRNVKRTASLEFQSAERRPRRLIEARGVGKRYGERTIFAGVDLTVGAGDAAGAAGAERLRQVDAAARVAGRGAGQRRQRVPGRRARGRVLRAGARRARSGAQRRRHRLPGRRLRVVPRRARPRPRLPGSLPVRVRAVRHGGGQAVGRRAEPAAARPAHAARGAGAGARRADQRSGPGDAVGAGGDADRVRRRGAAGVARSLLRRSGGDDDPRVRSDGERARGTGRSPRSPTSEQWEAWRAERRPRQPTAARRPRSRDAGHDAGAAGRPGESASATRSSANTRASRQRSPPPRPRCARPSPTASGPRTRATTAGWWSCSPPSSSARRRSISSTRAGPSWKQSSA